MTLYPLTFEPIYKPKIWGGRTLETRLGRALPAGEMIGESWEIADLGHTSPSGGGGEAARSRVAQGPLAGRTLHELIESYGQDLIGTLPLNERGEFPLLFKYLDARQNLSVQVHPDAAYARDHPDAHLKSEAWYIVAAEPGAVIYKGVREGVTPLAFRGAIQSGAVENLLLKVPVRAGDCHYLPSGTCHALGAGVLVAEVQTASDTTFRVYDWGRSGRELHVEEALRCVHFGPPDVRLHEPDACFERDGVAVRLLVKCEHFRVERLVAGAGAELPIALRGQPAVWMVLEGAGAIAGGRGAWAETRLARGQTLLLPASLDGATARFDEPTTLLEVTFPQAGAGLIA